MATEITNYKCPACTGPLHFVGGSGKLECDYCGSSYSVEEIEKLYAEQNAAAASVEESAEQHEYEEAMWGENMKAYTCPSCGAELVCDSTTSATSCPYCGNPAIVPSNFDGSLAPDLVIPFKLKKEDAIAALKNHYKGKKLLPKVFSEENHIQEIKGVYVPFWLYNAEADADLNFNAIRVGTHRAGKFRVTTTEHFKVQRAGKVSFNRIPVDASSKMPNDHMDSIEPYDYNELKPFSMAYLAGFLADKYDVEKSDCEERVRLRAEQSAETAMSKTVVGYTAVETESKDIQVRTKDVKYALLPVWLLSTKWNDTNYLFAMNGQTGKLVGDLPVDNKLFWKWFAIIAVPLAAILSLIVSL